MMIKSSLYKVVYYDGAKQDMNEAKEWYKQQLSGLQKRFTLAIKNTIVRIKNNPYAYAVRYENYRIAHPDTFPFGIHFFIDDIAKQIVITAIIHEYREFHGREE